MLAVLLSLALQGAELPEDVVHLTRGKPVTGVVLRVDDEQVLVGSGSRTKSIPRDKVDRIEGPRAAFPDYVGQLREHFTGQPTAKACIELAEWCAENGLVRDVRLHYLYALAVEPGNETAHRALGHSLKHGSWVVRIGNGGSARWDELHKRRMDFQEPWEFTTFHYELTAAGRLEEILRAAASLELLYASFFEAFQGPVGFYEVREPIKVRLYPDLESFPRQSALLDAYFQRDTRTLYSYFQEGKASNLLHEGTHALLYLTARELERKDPQIPGWLDEGLAIYMAAALAGPPGAEAFHAGRLDKDQLRAHVEEADPDSLTRVLNYNVSYFGSSTGQVRSYAQSYTLVHFLLHGGDEQLLEGFHRFVASSFKSQGSMSHFKKIMDVRDLDELEARWSAYVAKLGEELG